MKAYHILIFFLLFQITKSNGQVKLGKVLNDLDKSYRKLGKTTESSSNKAESNSNSNKKQSKKILPSSNRPLYSDLENEDFYQMPGKPNEDKNKTRVKFVGNILVDIEGKYPAGYAPSWNILKDYVLTQFITENLTLPNPRPRIETFPIKLAENNGKAYIITKSNSGECYGEIVVKNDYSVISNTKQVFELANFKTILNERFSEEPCFRNTPNRYPFKDFAGRISLTSDENGDIISNFLLEINSEETVIPRQYNKETREMETDVPQPSQVIQNYKYSNVLYSNNMSAKKAMEKENAELEAKKKYENYIKTSQTQIANLMKVIDKKYTGYDCKTCYYRNSQYGTETHRTKNVWSDGSVDYDTDYSINNTMVLKNRCSQEITFVGIKQLYSDDRGYYYEAVEKKWPANFYQESTEGLLMSIFTSMTGLDGDIRLSSAFDIDKARVGGIQWIKIVGKNRANPK